MNSSIRVTEIFYSLQGELRYIGVPSIFMRTFGCNFRCKNFGLSKAFVKSFGCSKPVTEKHNPEVAEIIKDISQYHTLSQLPIVKTGCDSYPSVYPEFKDFSPEMTIYSIVKKMKQLLPNNNWLNAITGNRTHLVITGGEPLLGWQKHYVDLFSAPDMENLMNITFETNGTQFVNDELVHYIKNSSKEFTFAVSPKLSASGEPWDAAIRPEKILQYQNLGWAGLKFVVDSERHFDEVDSAVAEYRRAGFAGSVYVMPEGGNVEHFSKNATTVANWALARGYYYSTRLQVSLWGNGWAC